MLLNLLDMTPRLQQLPRWIVFHSLRYHFSDFAMNKSKSHANWRNPLSIGFSLGELAFLGGERACGVSTQLVAFRYKLGRLDTIRESGGEE
jgi:hypothetical protein